MAILYFSLLLAAIGAGGIRPCVAAFGADQFVGVESKHKTKTWVFFNWYYFVMGASTLLATTVLVYIQDNVGWGWGLGIPTLAMLFSIPIFVAGYPLYRFLDPAGSPYTRLLQITVAAFRKRNVPMVSDPNMLYRNNQIDASISADGMLHHTKQLR
jgi:peptide/histidine transporter 3/4